MGKKCLREADDTHSGYFLDVNLLQSDTEFKIAIGMLNLGTNDSFLHLIQAFYKSAFVIFLINNIFFQAVRPSFTTSMAFSLFALFLAVSFSFTKTS